MDDFCKELVGQMRMLKKYALKLCHNPDLAEDLVQETLVRALAYRDNYTPGTNLGGYVAVILRNQYFEVRRKAKRCVEHSQDPTELNALTAFAGDDQLGALIAKDAISRIEGLPEAMRSTLYRYSQGDTLAEIAALEGVEIGTIKSRIHRAKASLAGLLGDRDLLRAKGTRP